MFFHFNLLCQKPAYFCFANTTAVSLPFLYCFLPLCPFPLLLKHFARCHLKFRPLFSYSLLFHSLSFWGSLRSFSMSVCFNSRFLTFFILFFALCLFPFAFGTFRPLPFGISPFAIWAYCALPFGISPVVFLFSVVSFAVFWGQYSLFFNVCLFQQSFPYLFVYCLLPLCPFFPLLLKHFALCPFQFYKQPFALYFPPFVVFFLFCVWDSPFALLLTAICCKNLLLDKKFSKNKKSLEIVIKTFDNT